MNTCEICEHSNDVGTFADFTCGACGQRHTWTEGQAPVLSESQLRLLRQHANVEMNALRPSGAGKGDGEGSPPVSHVERIALNFLLTRIGSWTHARWDQHLRERFGDEHTETVIRWLAERGIRPYIPKGTGGRRLQEEPGVLLAFASNEPSIARPLPPSDAQAEVEALRAALAASQSRVRQLATTVMMVSVSINSEAARIVSNGDLGAMKTPQEPSGV